MSSTPPEVRVLPMDLLREFPNCKDVGDLQREFFQKELPSREGGRYFFKEQGLIAPEGTMVLFQCQGLVIASAVLVSVERFKTPEKGYKGALCFDVSTIKTFHPVGPEQVRQIWPDFTKFSQAKLSLSPSGFQEFDRLFGTSGPLTIAEEIVKAAKDLVGSNRNAVFSRKEVRDRLPISVKDWQASYSPIFQGMRVDQPGGAPVVGKKFKDVFRQVRHGIHSFTDYGWQLALESIAGSLPPTRYWLTTQWPREVDSGKRYHENIYLREGHQVVGQYIMPGDRVLTYEALVGRIRLEQSIDGTKTPRYRHPGRKGIVTIAEVRSPLRKRLTRDSFEEYLGGKTMNWAWQADTQNHLTSGFVSKSEVLKVLGHSPKSSLRGFGRKHSGLMEITKEQYESLVQLFVDSSNTKMAGLAPGGRKPPQGHWTEGGGEGPEHLTLKEYVAANPAAVLREDGVRHLRTEYPFPSGDRADIVLRDREGRFLGVEIELEQDDKRFEGVLQAIKYRFMLAPMEGVTFEECRSVLVAYRLSDKVKQICRQYEVQTVEVTKEDVASWAASQKRGK